MKLKPLALLLALPSSVALADPLSTLDEIIVTATRVQPEPLGSSTVDAGRLSALRAVTSDAASLLRDVPGVSLYGAGGVSSLPSIHGLADDRLRIKVDGMDLIATCPNHMNPALSYIDPTEVGRIQVYAGATPVSLGGDSIGGAIIVETDKPKFAKAGGGLLKEGEVGAAYRSNGDGRSLNAKLTIAGENLSVAYRGAKAEAGNYTAGGNFKDALFGNPANSAFTGRAGHTLPLDEVGSTAYESTNQSLDVAWRDDHHLIAFTYTHQNIPFENFVNQRMDMTGNESDKFNLSYEGRLGWGVLKARAYHEETDHEMDFGADKRYWYGSATGGAGATNPPACSPLSATCAAGMPMYAASKTDGLSLSGEIPLSERDTLRVGGEYQAYRLDDWWPESGAMMYGGGVVGDESFWNINDGKRDRYAVFAEWEAKLDSQWTGQIGARHELVRMNAGDVRGYDINSAPPGSYAMTNADATAFNASNRKKTDHNLDLTALAKYIPDDNQTYEFGLAQKTRSPNLYERYSWSTWQMAALMNNFVGDGNGYFGNINLKPEVAHTVSVSADWHATDRNAWGLRATPYYTRVKDYIDAVQWTGDSVTGSPSAANLAGQYTILRYVNQSARLYGLDISGFTRLATGTAWGDFSLAGQLNWVDGKNRDTGDNLYNMMPLNGKLALTQKWGRWSGALEGVFVAAKDDVSAVRNELKTDGYSLFNLRASYAWKQVRIDFGVENLFDRAYDLPLGGAYLGQGTTMTTATVPTGVVPLWGTAVPGPGRSIYAGLNVKF